MWHFFLQTPVIDSFLFDLPVFFNKVDAAIYTTGGNEGYETLYL